MFEFGLGFTGLFTPVLYGVALLVIVLTLTYRIEIGIYFLAFFLPLQNMLDYVKDYPMGEDINDLLLIAMFIKWMISSRKPDEPLLQPSSIYLPIFLFMGWTAIEVIRGAEFLGLGMPTSLHHPLLMAWKNFWIPGILFFIVLNNIKTPLQIKILVLVTTASLLMLGRNFFNILSQQEIEHYSDSVKEAFLAGGAALSGNCLAVFMAQYAIIFVSLFLHDKNKWRRSFFLLTASLSYYCILFIFSRGGYFAAAASLLFLGIIKERKILIPLFAVFIFYQTLLPTAVIERIEMTKTDSGYDATTMQRLGMWDQAKAMIAESPLLGWGFSITPYIEVKAGAAFGKRYWGSFHNNFLQTTVELGFIGISLLMWIYFQGMWLGWKLLKKADDPFYQGVGIGFVASVLGILAGNVNGSYWHFYTVASFFWIYLALVIRLMVLTNEEQAIDSVPEQAGRILRRIEKVHQPV